MDTRRKVHKDVKDNQDDLKTDPCSPKPDRRDATLLLLLLDFFHQGLGLCVKFGAFNNIPSPLSLHGLLHEKFVLLAKFVGRFFAEESHAKESDRMRVPYR